MQIETYTEKNRATLAAKRDERTRPLWTALAVLGLVFLSPPPAAAADKAAGKAANAPAKFTTAHRAPARAATVAAPKAASNLKRAVFAREQASREVRHIANWVVDSGDNEDLPFALIDKKNARIFVFEPGGRIKGSAPVLLGIAKGDHTVPGMGEREYSDMRPEDRTTPAGRFVAERGRNMRGEDVVWVDYDSAVSLHRVVKGTVEERRAQRLNSPTAADNRISYGCINAPASFFNKVINPTFTGTNGIIYVLPETKPARQVFASYEVGERRTRQAAAHVAPTITARQAAVNPAPTSNVQQAAVNVAPTSNVQQAAVNVAPTSNVPQAAVNVAPTSTAPQAAVNVAPGVSTEAAVSPAPAGSTQIAASPAVEPPSPSPLR